MPKNESSMDQEWVRRHCSEIANMEERLAKLHDTMLKLYGKSEGKAESGREVCRVQ
jgi:hypothetical protein